MQKFSTCLWFDTQAEEAANFYVSLFEDSKVTDVQRLDGTPSGDNVALVFFRLAGTSSSPSTADRSSRSPRPSRSTSASTTRPRSTACGTPSPPTAARRDSAAG